MLIPAHPCAQVRLFRLLFVLKSLVAVPNMHTCTHTHMHTRIHVHSDVYFAIYICLCEFCDVLPCLVVLHCHRLSLAGCNRSCFLPSSLSRWMQNNRFFSIDLSRSLVYTCSSDHMCMSVNFRCNFSALCTCTLSVKSCIGQLYIYFFVLSTDFDCFAALTPIDTGFCLVSKNIQLPLTMMPRTHHSEAQCHKKFFRSAKIQETCKTILGRDFKITVHSSSPLLVDVYTHKQPHKRFLP